ncbi:MAG: recombinase RecA [Candidatus Aureabacteria bacterium]|nr:recombinase RecA [Candidatus Auribacterota bacterium]
MAESKNSIEKGTKEKAMKSTVAQIEKQFGEGTIMKMGEGVKIHVATISTGSLSLDIATGIGGIPRGRIIEIFGPESSGKTTLALQIVANAQKAGGIAAYIDAENALDPTYARKIGVSIEEILVSQPDSGEDALTIAEMLVKSNAIDVIVIDSVAALVPRAELEGDMGDKHVGLQARLMSQALRKLTSSINKSRTSCVFINQIREKIGVMFGNPETTPGGRALKFYASMRLNIRRISTIKTSSDEVIGNRTLVKVVKNKLAAPFKSAEFDIIYNEGISREGDVLDLAVKNSLVEKKGSWFSIGEERIAQGRSGAVSELKTNKKLFEKLVRDIRKIHFSSKEE